MSKHGELVADLLAARRDDGHVAPVVIPQLAELCSALDKPPPPGFERLKPLLLSLEQLPKAKEPAKLGATLRDYQQQGVAWLQRLRALGLGGILADDMGLGKTLQALCAVGKPTLVVCPTSVVHNWMSEIERFRPDLSACLFHGPKRKLDGDADVVVTSYALLRLEQEHLGAVHWDTLILDEAQAIKNPDSQSARAAFALKARFRVALSGTPIENRLEELWSLCHFTNPGLLGGRRDFRRRFVAPIAAGDGEVAKLLRQKLRPFVLRRQKQEVAPELPARTEMVLTVELTEAERAVYHAILAATRDDVVAKLQAGGSVMLALEALLRLRQAACHPSLVPGQPQQESSKLACLLEALDSAISAGGKALVFSQWTSLLDLVEPALTSADISFTRLDGSTPNRQDVVQRFQSDDGPPVLIASLKAGGTGLNLTAADHVFLLDPWWNPAAEDQAADRAHRIGQDKPVMIYRLVASDTVEERVLALQESKRAVADAALGEAEKAASLTRDDLLGLLA